MSTVTELKNALDAAEVTRNTARYNRDRMRDQLFKQRVEPLLKQANDEKLAIEREVQQAHDKLVDDAVMDAYHARRMYDAARVEAASKDTGWYPVGTKVWLWEAPRFGRDKTMHRTRTAALVEVWSNDSLRNSRLGGWRLPSPGDLVLRFLKQDGKPAVQFHTFNDGWHKERWFAEGEGPKQEVPHAAQA